MAQAKKTKAKRDARREEATGDQEGRVLATNRRAGFDYAISETVEAGLVLMGSEIKSARAGRAQIGEAYARVENGEAWLHNMHIPVYEPASRFNHEPTRPRKLLLHRKQIVHLADEASQSGVTLVPLRLYVRNDVAKIAIGVGRGKRQFDKRQAIAERESDREMQRALGSRQRDA
jgi:SsrA-binding protein